MPDRLAWTVYGLPAPQGSARAFLHRATSRVIVTHDNHRTLSWRQDVAAALVEALAQSAHQARIGRPLWPRPAAVHLRAVFYVPRPKSLPKRIQTPASRPDLDKLLRAALDAMTGLLFDDDAQVAAITAAKAYGAPRAEFEATPVWGATPSVAASSQPPGASPVPASADEGTQDLRRPLSV